MKLLFENWRKYLKEETTLPETSMQTCADGSQAPVGKCPPIEKTKPVASEPTTTKPATDEQKWKKFGEKTLELMKTNPDFAKIVAKGNIKGLTAANISKELKSGKYDQLRGLMRSFLQHGRKNPLGEKDLMKAYGKDLYFDMSQHIAARDAREKYGGTSPPRQVAPGQVEDPLRTRRRKKVAKVRARTAE